jgi:hypothetical protein
MNKKNIVTKERIERVANWLEKAVKHFAEAKTEEEELGCCHYHFNFTNDLAAYCGWSDGYDMADTDIIKAKGGREKNDSWVCGYALNVGIRVRNDWDDSDYDMMTIPYFEDSGECYDYAVSLWPNMTRRDYKRVARGLIEDVVNITNLYNKGELCYE